ncbi:hypothetical protein E2C01_005566 [Portunus trituberculatus]|uniref:Uncharacterized protein n=1 Tax=Portunus trituberculatus TaxID=210409 RepID=A0A5B7CT19_PORTR|nr:hypothetical protein [Portunus trituberculatus]
MPDFLPRVYKDSPPVCSAHGREEEDSMRIYSKLSSRKHEVGLSTVSNPAFRNEGERFPSLAALFPPGDERHAWLHD